MNYLSHFYFDRNQEDSYFVLGLALPDLIKAFDKSWNVHPQKMEAIYRQDHAFRGIASGWEKHVAVDKLFHNSEFFKSGMARLKETLHSTPFESDFLRPFILVHIGLELLLDSLLIRNKKADPKVFYKHLSDIDRQKMVQFLQIGGIVNAPACQTKYQWFIETRYLNSYTDTEQLAFALSQICRRIWGREVTSKDKAIFQNMFQEGLESFASDYILIFDQIEAALQGEK